MMLMHYEVDSFGDRQRIESAYVQHFLNGGFACVPFPQVGKFGFIF